MESVKKRKRAVAYVRVSSGSDAQIHSFEFQSAYWHNELDSNPDVEMVGIYADKGICLPRFAQTHQPKTDLQNRLSVF